MMESVDWQAAECGMARRSTEVAATVILALPAVATAWSGYQASRWHGEQAIAQWVDADARDETGLAGLARSHGWRRSRSASRPGRWFAIP
jgi:hypothetical protein